MKFWSMQTWDVVLVEQVPEPDEGSAPCEPDAFRGTLLDSHAGITIV